MSLSEKPKDITQNISQSDVFDPNHKLTKEEAMELRETENEYKEALASVKDMIAPAMMRVDATKLQI